MTFQLKSIIVIALMFCISLANAQENGKITATIKSFTHTSSAAVNADFVPSVTQYTANAFQKYGNFNLVDRTSLSSVEEEQKQGRSLTSSRAEQGIESGKIEPAQYLILGEVDKLIVEQKYDKDGQFYQAQISFLLKVTKTTTSEVIASEQMSSNTQLGRVISSAKKGLFRAKTEQQAIEQELKNLDEKLQNFINSNFRGNSLFIVQLEEESNGNAQKVLVAGGKKAGFNKRTRLIVFTESIVTINGQQQTREQQVGELKVEQVENDNFAICSVKEGGKAIFSGLNSGKKLYIKTKVNFISKVMK